MDIDDTELQFTAAEGAPDSIEAQPAATDESGPTPMNHRKRRRNDDGGSAKKKKKTTSSGGSSTQSTSADVWHLKKSDVPKAALGVQNALQIHLRILGLLCSPLDVLPRLSSGLATMMQARLSDGRNLETSVSTAITKARNTSREAALKLDELRNAIAHAGNTNKKSAIYRHMRRMLSYEDHLKFAYSALLGLGLSTWNPDVYGNNPDSPFNLLHERIAISTFEHMCTSFAYTSFSVNFAQLKDAGLLQKLYRHFVFSYLRKNGEKELERPGTLKEEAELANLYKRRKKTRKGRVGWLKAQGYNKAVVRLVDRNEAHSEDEYDAQVGGYVVKAVTGRSPAVTRFLIWIDDKRATVVQPGRGQNTRRTRFTPRKRIRVSPSPAPVIVALPKKVPVDYFDPDYFNENILPRDRAKYADCGVALPPESVRGSTIREHMVWNNMDDDEFGEKYGKEVFAQYHIPTPEELSRIAEYEADGEGETDDDEDDDDDEDGDDDDE